MVKSVLGDETRFKSAEDRLFKTNIPAEVGLVIGKLNSDLDRGFIFDLIPTPLNDDGQPACSLSSIIKPDKKKPPKPKSQLDSSSSFSSSLVLDTDWISEHARQVSRMLLGGVNVIGIYIWSPEFSFNSSTTTLLQVIQGVASALATPSSSSSSSPECVVVHISFSPRKLTVRNCVIDSGNMRICDFKLGRVLCSLRSFKCLYNFEFQLPIFKQGTFRDVICNGVLSHGKELRGAKAIIDGDLVVDDQLLIPDGANHNVELLLQVGKGCVGEVKEQIDGIVVFSGHVCSMAYLSSKESIQQALSDIREDIVMSLLSRLNVICDEAEESMGSMDGNGEISNESSSAQLGLHYLKKATSLSFPRRVLVPWKGDVFVCDYLQPSDTFDVVQDHCKELLSMETPADSSQILEPENEAMSLTVKSFWDAVVPNSSASELDTDSMVKQEKDKVVEEGSKRSAMPATFSTVTAFSILLLAIVIGYFFYRN